MRGADKISVVRVLLSALILVAVPVAAVPQTLSPKALALQHATVAGALSAPSVAPGGTVTLWADVTPKPGIHIYAAGSQEFSAVALVLAKRPGVTPGAPAYPPPSAPVSLKTAVADAPAYYGKFRITQPVTIAKSAKSGDALVVEGRVNYQACDDRLCYPVTSEPVTWTLTVK
jgi:hypothetical protein